MGKHDHCHRPRTCPEDEKKMIEKLVRSCRQCECECEETCGEHFSKEEALRVARLLCVNVNSPCFDLDEFWRGMNVELEHGTVDPLTNITNNDPLTTGKIVLVHVNQLPDYYTRLEQMLRDGREYWRRFRNSI